MVKFITESTAYVMKDDRCPSSGLELVKRKQMTFKKTVLHDGSWKRWNVVS